MSCKRCGAAGLVWHRYKARRGWFFGVGLCFEIAVRSHARVLDARVRIVSNPALFPANCPSARGATLPTTATRRLRSPGLPPRSRHG